MIKLKKLQNKHASLLASVLAILIGLEANLHSFLIFVLEASVKKEYSKLDCMQLYFLRSHDNT